jgi:hypothetical protein
MKFDLKTPCKNCPFRNDATRIRFACRERANEIEEQAYRRGFPCHKSAEYVEGDDYGDSGGYYAGEQSQHCAGYLIMQAKEAAGTPWPGIQNSDVLLNKIEAQLDFNAPAFDSVEEFLNANERINYAG